MESELTLRAVSAIDVGKGIAINDYTQLRVGKVKLPSVVEKNNVVETKEQDGLIV